MLIMVAIFMMAVDYSIWPVRRLEDIDDSMSFFCYTY